MIILKAGKRMFCSQKQDPVAFQDCPVLAYLLRCPPLPGGTRKGLAGPTLGPPVT